MPDALLGASGGVRRVRCPGTRGVTVFAAVALLAGALPAAANSPWTQSAGHGQLITKLGAFQATRAFDRNGDTTALAGAGSRFRRLDLNPYLEYGVTDRLTGVANLFLSQLESRQGGTTTRSTDLGDQELGLRYRLSRAADANPIFAVQGLAKLPLYGNGPGLRPGAGQYDLEGRLLAGYSLPLGTASAYLVAAPGYRWRSNVPANEWRLDLVAGLKPSLQWLITAELQGIRSVGAIGSSVGAAPGNPGEGQNFARWRTQLAATYFVRPDVGVMLGAYQDIAGRNVAKGTGVMAGLWLRF